MGTPENVNFGWNDYESHLCSSVNDLKNYSTFSNVTLVRGKTQVKVILASFSRVLHDHPHPHLPQECPNEKHGVDFGLHVLWQSRIRDGGH